MYYVARSSPNGNLTRYNYFVNLSEVDLNIIVRETYFHYIIFMQVLAYMLYRPIDTRINVAWIS